MPFSQDVLADKQFSNVGTRRLAVHSRRDREVDFGHLLFSPTILAGRQFFRHAPFNCQWLMLLHSEGRVRVRGKHQGSATDDAVFPPCCWNYDTLSGAPVLREDFRPFEKGEGAGEGVGRRCWRSLVKLSDGVAAHAPRRVYKACWRCHMPLSGGVAMSSSTARGPRGGQLKIAPPAPEPRLFWVGRTAAYLLCHLVHPSPLCLCCALSSLFARSCRPANRSHPLRAYTSSSANGEGETDLDDIWDEKLLRHLLEKCSDYEGRRKIRARLRTVMAEQQACEEVVTTTLAGEDAGDDDRAACDLQEERGESLLLPFLVEHLRSSLQDSNTAIDSGTESGEDLKMLAVGLRDSMENGEALGPSLLAEVGSALARLQASLSLGGGVEPGRKEVLLQLISRLQASLRLPAPPWGSQRPVGRRPARQNRHTVGVSREELADARRLLEQQKQTQSQVQQTKVEKNEKNKTKDRNICYPLMKQNSSGAIGMTMEDSSGPIAPLRAFRPVKFIPRKDPVVLSSGVANSTAARPFIAYSSQQHGPSFQDKDVRNGSSEKNVAAEDDVKDECGNVMVAVHREYRPGKMGDDSVRPIRRQSASQSSTPQGFDSSTSAFDRNKSLSQSSSAGSVALSHSSSGSISRTSTSQNVSNKGLSQSSSCDSEMQMKDRSSPYTSDQVVVQPEVVRGLQKNHNEPSAFVPYSRTTHRPISQSLSLDSNQKTTHTHKPVMHALSLDSSHRDYDPSVILFTPEQSVQIAVHKAAINKQISVEETRRKSLTRPSGSDDEGSDLEEEDDASSEDSCITDSEGEPEELPVPPTRKTFDKANAVGYSETSIPESRKTYNESAGKSYAQQSNRREKHETSDSVLNSPLNNKANYYEKQQMITEVHGSDTSKKLEENRYNTTTQSVESRARMFQQETDCENGISSAQRLLQMATDNSKPVGKPRGHSDKKVKMKRANTIDIPKPLNFYAVEGDSECSDDEDHNKQSVDKHRAAYLALRGPIRVGSTKSGSDDKAALPVLQPRTDSDRKFLAFMEQQNEEKPKTAAWNLEAAKSPGGLHWNSRFSNIKTTFEPKENQGQQTPWGSRVVSGPAAARKFWQSADDSMTGVKTNSATATGPKLSRQGSIFLKKLFEQKDREKQEKEVDGEVVVGSLTVAGAPGTVLSKRQLFASPVSRFSHAPLSAFKPIEKKSNQVWATPSVSGTVKQLASQKFSTGQLQRDDTDSPVIKTLPKQRPTFLPYESVDNDVSTSPVSPTLPWTREGFPRASNCTVAKFENLSREPSPQPVPVPPPRGRSQERVTIPPTLSLFTPKPAVQPAPPPRAFMPPPNPLSLTPEQSAAISQSTYVPSAVSRNPPPPPIPSPLPELSAPTLVQTGRSDVRHTEPAVQTYSGSVTSRTSIYPSAIRSGYRPPPPPPTAEPASMPIINTAIISQKLAKVSPPPSAKPIMQLQLTQDDSPLEEPLPLLKQ
ncbi:hypothetical protein PR048_017610 [Dryococelus australis]|uniref:Smoothelin domain-containing protein n=1 Tax=Dryococelus australis TaxID=614101 RepID=A0ABQ9HA20_9NEOP|nr:hypothetical protein PR048_017610 [Dryococelus australis]